MVTLKSAAYLRSVWYTLPMMSTVTVNPVRVVAPSINSFIISTVWNDHALTGTGRVREELVFNRVVLRGIGRVVRHPHLEPRLVRQPL